MGWVKVRVVSQVGQHPRDDPPRIIVGQPLEPPAAQAGLDLAPGAELGDHLIDAPSPAGLRPGPEQRPAALGVGGHGPGRREEMGQGVEEVDDRHEGREIPPVQPPDPGRAVPQERPGGRRGEVPPSGLGGDHRPEAIDRGGRGHVGAHRQLRRAPRRDGTRGGRDRQHGRLLDLGGRRAHRSGPADGPDDPLDVGPVAEAGGQLRLGVALGGDTGHRRQDRDLVLAPGRLVGPGPLALAADLEPAAVDLDDGQGRPRLDARLRRAGPESVHLLIALGSQLLADFAGDAVELPAADAHLGQVGDGLGGLA